MEAIRSIFHDYHYVVIALAAFSVAAVLSMLAHRVIRYAIKKRWEEGKEDVTRLKFLANSVSALFYAFAIAYIFSEIPTLSNLGNAIFAGAGVLAAVIGFASQKAFSNIISGVFILLFRPFKVGDAVSVGARSGAIEDITLRHTVIRDYENRRVIIPNSIISDETIVNYDITDKHIRQQIFFGVAYETDLNKAISIIQTQAEAHPHFIDKRTRTDRDSGVPAVMVRVMAWEASSIQLRAQVWTKDIDHGFVLKCDLLHSVKEAFDTAGISIPYPHMTLVQPEDLSG